MTIKMNSKLVSAVEMHRENPNTFEIPDTNEIETIRPGDNVKVCSGRERFWVEISRLGEEGEFFGTVNNDLIYTDEHGFSFGDEISLYAENIYDIFFQEGE